MFKNEPLTDFSVAENRSLFSAALDEVRDEIARGRYVAYPLIGGEPIKDIAAPVERRDPSDLSVTVGHTYFAASSHVSHALDHLAKEGPRWSRTPFEARSEILRKAGALMRTRRHKLAALIVREAGKPWREADADVAEAIDFCEYYAQEMMRLGPPQRLVEVPGESDIYFYRPRGIAVAIAPWNFPLAIACGMAVAALVSGNPTVLKPAEQTSLIAYEFATILHEAGVPGHAFAFLPGIGETVGSALVQDARTALICFTGSKAVGLEILQRASRVEPGQRHIKRVITELGGKNCIIIDEDADLDEAIKGVLYSAFGFSGQKCSACSRVVVVKPVYEQFLARLEEAARDLIVGAASDPPTLLGPVIDEESRLRIGKVIQDARGTLPELFVGNAPSLNGHYVPPAIFRDVDTSHSLWREEVFGPVLACRAADTFSEALALANDCEYALTGGLFSRSPAHIERAYNEFEVGNLYINRGCTGALVCRQPFGGFKLSGVGSKAGGPDYLLQFMEPVAVCENTMRRGFAPE